MQVNMLPKIVVILLNWNGWKDTIECLESLYQITYSNYSVIVVDNGSEDESIEKIRAYCNGKIPIDSKFFEYDPNNKPIKIIEYSEEEIEIDNGESRTTIYEFPANKKLILIKNKKNYGFAKGNNIGIQFSLKKIFPDYIFLLNNDTVVTKNFLDELMNHSLTNGKVGIWSPKVLKYPNPSLIDSTGHVFRWGYIRDRGEYKVDKGQYDTKPNIIGAISAAALYKIEMLQSIGLFDESFVTMYEDAELSWRAYKNGWKALFVPSSIVYHKRGSTVKKESKINREVTLLYIRNVATTVKCHGTDPQKIIFFFAFLKKGIFSMVGKLLGRNNIGIIPYLKALKRFIF